MSSSGSGLSGVYIAVDCALGQIETQGRVDVWDTVNSLRQQRPRMVYTLVRLYYIAASLILIPNSVLRRGA